MKSLKFGNIGSRCLVTCFKLLIVEIKVETNFFAQTQFESNNELQILYYTKAYYTLYNFFHVFVFSGFSTVITLVTKTGKKYFFYQGKQ